MKLRGWLSLLQGGDWILLSCATLAVGISFPLLWQSGPAARAVVRVDGRIVAELPLNAPRRLEVAGALGATIIEVQPGRARVLSDPGPRQYCVKQGWLSRPNAVAICAPSHVSLALSGGGYDTLNY